MNIFMTITIIAKIMFIIMSHKHFNTFFQTLFKTLSNDALMCSKNQTLQIGI